MFTSEPTLSIRKATQRVHFSRESVRTILKSELNLTAYKIQSRQLLTAPQVDQRLDFARKMSWRINRKIIKVENIWFTDEAHFELYGYVNKQTHRFWGTEKPEVGVSRPHWSPRVTVWCAISSHGIIGPYFTQENVDSNVYQMRFLQNFIEEVSTKGLIADFWYQQDGAPAHRTQEVFDLLKEWFGCNIIGLDAPAKAGGGLEWPPNSPDLTPPDYFLWSYLKDRVYHNNPRNIEELKENIKTTIAEICDEMLSDVVDNFITRIKALENSDGGHFEQILH